MVLYTETVPGLGIITNILQPETNATWHIGWVAPTRVNFKPWIFLFYNSVAQNHILKKLTDYDLNLFISEPRLNSALFLCLFTFQIKLLSLVNFWLLRCFKKKFMNKSQWAQFLENIMKSWTLWKLWRVLFILYLNNLNHNINKTQQERWAF